MHAHCSYINKKIGHAAVSEGAVKSFRVFRILETGECVAEYFITNETRLKLSLIHI